MSNKIYSFLSIFSVILFSIMSIGLVSLNRSGFFSEIPYTIVETQGNVENLVAILEESENLQVLWRGNASIPISAFDTIELENLSQLTQELSRNISTINELESVFFNSQNNAEFLYVFGRIQDIERATAEYNNGIVLYSNNQFTMFGLVFFVIFSLILLILFKNRIYSLFSLLTFSSIFLIPSTFLIGISAILIISIRNFAISILAEFKKSLNARQFISLPESKKKSFQLFIKTISLYSSKLDHLIYIELVIFIVLALFLRYYETLMILVLIPLVMNLMWVEMKSIIVNMKQKEHSLFYASQIIPTWKIPIRTERAGLLALSALIITTPLLFNINSYNTQLVNTLVLGSVESDTDINRLRRNIISILDHHINPDLSPYQNDYLPIHILLADRAYQEIFPYLSLSSTEGQYSNGAISITRFRDSENGLRSYEEVVFQVTNEWVISQLSLIANYDMLRLYFAQGTWYNVRVVHSFWSSLPSIVIEIILFVLLTSPWIVPWQAKHKKKPLSEDSIPNKQRGSQ